MKVKQIFQFVIFTFSVLTLYGAVYAALEETVKVTGVTFNVGSTFGTGGGTGGGTTTGNTALKMLNSLTGGTVSTNLLDSKQGLTYDSINDVWTATYPVKIHNKSASSMNLVAMADYISDVDTLRDDIYVSIVEWNDADEDGVVDDSEEGQVYGNDTILRLKNDTFVLGTMAANGTRGFVYKFNGSGLTTTNAGQTATYDFTITGTAQ